MTTCLLGDLGVYGGLCPLWAYIGPGAALEMGGALLGLAATLGAAGTFIVLWPVRVLLRSWRGRRECAGRAPTGSL